MTNSETQELGPEYLPSSAALTPKSPVKTQSQNINQVSNQNMINDLLDNIQKHQNLTKKILYSQQQSETDQISLQQSDEERKRRRSHIFKVSSPKAQQCHYNPHETKALYQKLNKASMEYK